MGPTKQTEQFALTQVISDVEHYLNSYLHKQLDEAKRLNSDYANLWEVIIDLNAAGGKRIRPYMTMLSYRAFGGVEYKAVLPIASAMELLHCAMLVHDDIIDRDYVRRGKPNIAGQYFQKYQGNEDRSHLAASVALIAGDLLISAAYQVVLESDLSAEQKLVAHKIIGEAIFEVCGGELMDIEAVIYRPDEVNSLKIAELKTAGYSFDAPLRMGAKLAGASEGAINNLSNYARSVGVAFQLTDDLLGVFGDESVTGKPEGSDLKEAKRTYLLQRTLKNLHGEDKNEFEKLVGRDIDRQELERARDLMKQSGAVDEADSIIEAQISLATKALEKLNFDSDDRNEFEKLIKKSIKRAF